MTMTLFGMSAISPGISLASMQGGAAAIGVSQIGVQSSVVASMSSAYTAPSPFLKNMPRPTAVLSSAGRSIADYLFTRGIDVRAVPALFQRSSATPSHTSSAAISTDVFLESAMGIDVAGDAGDAEGERVLDFSSGVRSLHQAPVTPPPSKRPNPLKWAFEQTFARTDRASVVTTIMGSAEFAFLAPSFSWLVGKILQLTNDKIPEVAWQMPAAGSIGGIAAVCFAIGAVLFGLNGLPVSERVRETLMKDVPVIPKGWRLFSKHTIKKGFVLGKAQEINADNPRVIFEHPRVGKYTVADLKIWAHEIGINLAFYPAIGLALGLPVLKMLPMSWMSALATISTARTSKIWGASDRPFWWIVAGRTAVFSTTNAISPLAAQLDKTGVLPAHWGYAIQAGLMLLIAGASYMVVQPPKVEDLSEPGSDEAESA